MRRILRSITWALIGIVLVIGVSCLWLLYGDGGSQRFIFSKIIEAQTEHKTNIYGEINASLAFNKSIEPNLKIEINKAEIEYFSGDQSVPKSFLADITLSLGFFDWLLSWFNILPDLDGEFLIEDLDFSELISLNTNPYNLNLESLPAINIRGIYKVKDNSLFIPQINLDSSFGTVSGDIHIHDLLVSPNGRFKFESDILDLSNLGADEIQSYMYMLLIMNIPIYLQSAFEIRGEIRIEELFLDQMLVSNLYIPIYMTKEVIVSSGAKADFFDGTVGIDSVKLEDSDQTSIQISQKLEFFAIERFLRNLGMPEILSGNGSLFFNGQYTCARNEDCLNSAIGVVQLVIENGSISSVNTINLLRPSIVDLFPELVDYLKTLPPIRLNRIDTKFLVENGYLSNDDIRIETEKFSIKGSGNLSVVDKKMDLSLSLVVRDPDIISMIPVPLKNNEVILPIKVSGLISSPRVSIDVQKLISIQLGIALGPNKKGDSQVKIRMDQLEKILREKMSSTLSQYGFEVN